MVGSTLCIVGWSLLNRLMYLYVVQHSQWPINLQTRRHAIIIIKMVQKSKLDICSTITWHDYSVDGAFMAVKRWLEPQELATEGSVPVALQAAQCEPPSPIYSWEEAKPVLWSRALIWAPLTSLESRVLSKNLFFF